ncbi:MAG: helix-turn-helix transcriptional regulator [Propionibacteriaceae bacterium]|nr:helix-turn-helix domain-containing protein [Micropruina sp.]
MSATSPLGEFLRARRASLSPTDVGLSPILVRRRVPGLRREEVAQLAAISTDYYTRLEQGRISPSPTVITAIARALGLDDDQRAYLVEISGLGATAPRRPRTSDTLTTTPLPHLQVFIDDLVTTPVFVIGPRTEIVAWNVMGAALITDFATIPEAQRYYIRLLITDPRMRQLYADWDDVTRLAVEQLRRLNATAPEDPQLVALVRELSAIDTQFKQWWATHDVAPRTAGSKILRHPAVGTLQLDWSALTWNADPDLQLIVWTAPPGSPTRERLLRLRALADASLPRE